MLRVFGLVACCRPVVIVIVHRFSQATNHKSYGTQIWLGKLLGLAGIANIT